MPGITLFGKLPCLLTAFQEFFDQGLGLLGPGLPVKLVLERCAQLIIGLLS